MAHSLLSHGERPATIALLAKGFRPFFLLAAAFAGLILPLWLLVLFGVTRPGSYLAPSYWHAHEMVFGFATAVIAGFLLTAVSNWTHRDTASGPSLAALSLLWCLGRVVMIVPTALPRAVVALVDVSFLPALMLAVGAPLIATKGRRNYVMLGVLGALAAANVCVHLGALGVAPSLERRGCIVGVDIVVLLSVVMAGRVVPMFTRNATGVSSVRSMPAVDKLAAGAMALVVLLDALMPDRASTAPVAAVAGALVLLRSAHWGTRHTLREPLLWVLHAGNAWIGVGLVLRLIAPPSIATHALTVGAIGALTLGMMARVALGHTGRPLALPRPMATGFVFVTLAAFVRVIGATLPAVYRASLVLAGTLWTAAFVVYAVVYAPILLAPRVDGRAG